MASTSQVLLLGAGELGSAFLTHLSTLPNLHITVGVRNVLKYSHLTNTNVSLASIDTSGPSAELSQIFARYDIVISAMGFGQEPETIRKVTGEMLEAGKIRRAAGKGKLWYFPW